MLTHFTFSMLIINNLAKGWFFLIDVNQIIIPLLFILRKIRIRIFICHDLLNLLDHLSRLLLWFRRLNWWKLMNLWGFWDDRLLLKVWSRVFFSNFYLLLILGLIGDALGLRDLPVRIVGHHKDYQKSDLLEVVHFNVINNKILFHHFNNK